MACFLARMSQQTKKVSVYKGTSGFDLMQIEEDFYEYDYIFSARKPTLFLLFLSSAMTLRLGYK